MTSEGRSLEVALEIDVPAEAVWRALTEAGELVRWFPLQAEVTPGEGGSVLWAWDDAWGSTMRIEAWEPPRLLRLVQDETVPYDADGRPLPRGAEARRVAIEVTLATRRGKTSLTLVHSGFGEGASWDDEVEGTSAGWHFELRSLRLYLERHRGSDRRYGWAKASVPLPQDEVWRRLLSADGVRLEAARLAEGEPFSLTLPSGRRFSGLLMAALPDREIAGVARELGDGVVRLSTHRAAGATGINLWASSYTHEGDVEAFGREAQALLRSLFSPAPVPVAV